jgi:hypothetical protein
MNRYIFLFSLLLSCSNQGHAKESLCISQSSSDKYPLCIEAKILKRTYASDLLTRAIDHVVYKKEPCNYFDYNDSIGALLKERPTVVDSLLYTIQEQKNDKENVFKNIGVWCDTYVILSTYMNIDELFSVEEILWEIPCTKKIIQSYLSSPLQDWGSLSEEQLYSLPHKICNLMCATLDKDRIAFYIIFYTKIKSKMVNHED